MAPDYWEKIESLFPSIVSQEVFNKTNITRAKSKNPNTPKIPHLTKIVVGEDGKALIFQTVQGKYPKYFNRSNYKEYIKAEVLHQIVFNDLKTLLTPFYKNEQQFIQKLYRKLQENSNAESKLEEKKSTLITEITNLFERKLIGNISEEQYQNQAKVLNKELKLIEEHLKEANSTFRNQTLDYKIKEFIKLLKSSKDKENFDFVYLLVDEIKITFQSKKEVNIEIQYKFITE